MPRIEQVAQIVAKEGGVEALGKLRNQFISDLSACTGRNTIVYYSGWLERPVFKGDFSITDADKAGFMAVMYEKEKRKAGLDLILHTPGGFVGATESLIDYLRIVYGGNIRTIVPQLAMSGGTLMAVSAKSIVMGAHSSLGPVDPQIMGFSAQLYLSEFDRAASESAHDPAKAQQWRQIIGKLNPGFLEYCRKGIDLSTEILTTSLKEIMFKNEPLPVQKEKIRWIKKLFVDTEQSKDHGRHISRDKAKMVGLNIEDLEEDKELQEKVLTLHHLLCLNFQWTNDSKIIASRAGGGKCYIFSSAPTSS